jgi:hypothetical protein
MAFNALIASPGTFLKTYPVRIFGDTAASGIRQYTMINRVGAVQRPGTFWGRLSMHATESFEIRSNAAMLAVGAPANPRQFQAHSVHMDAGIGAMQAYRLDATGPGIMVTSQLSGCSFVMTDAGAGQVDVAHVQPHGGMTGRQLHGQLSTAAGAQVYGASATRGNYDVADRVASIVGVRTAGAWRIYAQKQDRGHGYDIVSVYQIYPARQKL